ncbi:hypothetical protein QJS10_CPB18g01728 [Acorus calamus]|uniref:VPS37 C-terminal domain-containing protein n=1 Tax=Acorus calamus TaxID=4465 RepID=A0AAV9CPS7_ACOCL|nr:hypothetical protein QJS10_CPB18g01728 [Acorus calamus]
MSWKFPINFMGGAQGPPIQPDPSELPTQSWYSSSVASTSPGSSRPATPSTSSLYNSQQKDRPQSPQGQLSPAEAAGIIAFLKDKSIDDLRKLLNDKDAYNNFLHSLDQVKDQNNFRDELLRETLQLARDNLEKEPRILELKNQCRIIRTTELAAAQEKLNELERQKDETLSLYSPSTLLQKLQDAINNAEEESDVLHCQLLEKEIDLPTFIQKYKKIRTTYHRRNLIHLAAKTSIV